MADFDVATAYQASHYPSNNLSLGYSEPWYTSSGTGSINNIEGLFQGLVSEQRRMNELQMQREDTAYQRMVADMEKAGLNPWTGISSGGSSSSSLQAPNSSALERLLGVLEYNEGKTTKDNQNILSAINTGIKVALPFLALLGV